MSERKLASIQKIVELNPIAGADRIELATVLGWQVIVEKGLHKVGDLIVYCEVDSLMPDREEFMFLSRYKFRVKTMRMRKVISQGIVFPYSILPLHKLHKSEGTDVTELLGVKKYDPQGDREKARAEQNSAIYNNRMVKFLKRYGWFKYLFVKFGFGKMPSFPPFIQKTDEDRIQLFPNICSREAKTAFDVTEKLDGQSATYFAVRNTNLFTKKRKPWVFGVCSRNLQRFREDNSSYWTIAKQYDIKNKLIELCEKLDSGIAVQGEIIGEGIQGNKYGLKGYDFYVYNIRGLNKEEDRHNRLDTEDMKLVASSIGLKPVPVLERSMFLAKDIPTMVTNATLKSTLCDVWAEGVVCRNYEKNISFKIINPEFLLGGGE